MRTGSEFIVDSNEMYFRHFFDGGAIAGAIACEDTLYGLHVCPKCLEEIEEMTGPLKVNDVDIYDEDNEWETLCDWCGHHNRVLFVIWEDGIDKALKMGLIDK